MVYKRQSETGAIIIQRGAMPSNHEIATGVSFVNPVGVFEAALRRHFRGRKNFLPLEIKDVIEDVIGFIFAILHDGFRSALAQSINDVKVNPDRPIVEVCDAIVEHHIRMVRTPDREIIGKALFESYVHFAGPDRVFEPESKTRLMRALRRLGVKGFIASFLSLYVFSKVTFEIQEATAAHLPDLKSLEVYMLGIETVCRDVVTRAMKIPERELDAEWAAIVCRNIEAQLLHAD